MARRKPRHFYLKHKTGNRSPSPDNSHLAEEVGAHYQPHAAI